MLLPFFFLQKMLQAIFQFVQMNNFLTGKAYTWTECISADKVASDAEYLTWTSE